MGGSEDPRIGSSIPEDNRALLEIPALQVLKVNVYTAEPDLLKPALAAHPQIQATFLKPSEYKPDPDASVVVLDRLRASGAAESGDGVDQSACRAFTVHGADDRHGCSDHSLAG